MYDVVMRDRENLTIPPVIKAFTSASAALHTYLQQRPRLSAFQIKSLYLRVSLTEYYLEQWMRHRRNPVISLGGRDFSYAARVFGRLGGLKGGRARAKKLSSKERAAIARRAALTRWGKRIKPTIN